MNNNCGCRRASFVVSLCETEVIVGFWLVCTQNQAFRAEEVRCRKSEYDSRKNQPVRGAAGSGTKVLVHTTERVQTSDYANRSVRART